MDRIKRNAMMEFTFHGETSISQEMTLNNAVAGPPPSTSTKAMCHDLLAEPFSPDLDMKGFGDFGAGITDSLGDASMDSFTDLTTLLPVSTFFDQTISEEESTTPTAPAEMKGKRPSLKRTFSKVGEASSDLSTLCTRVGVSRLPSVDHDYSTKRPRLAPESAEEMEGKSDDLFVTPTPSPSSRSTDSPSSTVPDSTQDKHRLRREKNNIASKRSREIRKQKFVNMEQEAERLNEENARLEQRVVAMEAMAKCMKDMLVARMGLQR